MTYAQKLKDPRWQKKRLEILNRDEFACRICGDKKKTLHVHHRAYAKGLEPWEVEDAALLTVCEGCHERLKQAIGWISTVCTPHGLLLIETFKAVTDQSFINGYEAAKREMK